MDLVMVIGFDYNLHNFQSSQSIFFLPSYKNFALIFALVRAIFFVNLYEMIEIENNPDNYQTSTETIIKNPEMLKFILDYLKTRKMCKSADKKLLFVITYVPDPYKNQEMSNKVILENGGMLKFISEFYKNKTICDKTVDYYSHALEFVPDYYKT